MRGLLCRPTLPFTLMPSASTVPRALASRWGCGGCLSGAVGGIHRSVTGLRHHNCMPRATSGFFAICEFATRRVPCHLRHQPIDDLAPQGGPRSGRFWAAEGATVLKTTVLHHTRPPCQCRARPQTPLPRPCCRSVRTKRPRTCCFERSRGAELQPASRRTTAGQSQPHAEPLPPFAEPPGEPHAVPHAPRW